MMTLSLGCMATKSLIQEVLHHVQNMQFRNSAIGDLEPEPAGAVIAGLFLLISMKLLKILFFLTKEFH